MEPIESVGLFKLRNLAHYQLMADFDSLITKTTTTQLGITTLYPAFRSALTAEETALRSEQGSLRTKDIEEQDTRRDNILQALGLRIQSCMVSPLAEENTAAQPIKATIDRYGDLKNRTYNEETAGITQLVAELQQASLSANCDKAGIAQLVAELKISNTEFSRLMDERNAELASRTAGDVRAIRKTIDPVYHQIADHINAQITLNLAKPATISFVSQWNEKLRYYRKTLNQQAGHTPTTEKD